MDPLELMGDWCEQLCSIRIQLDRSSTGIIPAPSISRFREKSLDV